MPLVETLIGAAGGAILLAAFSRLKAKALAHYGFIALNVMLAVYIGAKLVTGSLSDILIEIAIATVAVVLVHVAMNRWLPAIGIAIVGHGIYDAAIGPHTGVAEWYPPLCAGFDLVVGIGLVLILRRKLAQQ